MRELWERTGMKTNGRKLLIESEDEEQLQGMTNAGYQSDGSEVSVHSVLSQSPFLKFLFCQN